MRAALSYVLLLALFAGVCASCSPVIQTYVDARDDWTRDMKVWEDFESRVFVDATLKNKAFRKEYVREYARIYSMTQEQQNTLLESELAEEEKYHVVVAAIFVAQREWSNLEPADGIWDVRLQDDQERWVRPIRIKQIDTDNPLWTRMYPYIGRHDLFYELRFPRHLDGGSPIAKAGESLHLIIAGAPAQVKLSWPSP